MNDSLNKSILMGRMDKTGTLYSPEELMTLRINSWLGWQCSAGVDNIHISPDGHVAPATCGVPVYHGNIYEGPLNFAKEWIQCPIKWCMCGADMRLRKAKTPIIREQLVAKPEVAAQSVAPLLNPDDAEFVASIHVNETKRFPKNVSWDISRRCNFKCSYCHPNISNQTDPIRTREAVFSAAFKIMRGFAPAQRISWVFTGGEPTLHPFFSELCEMLFHKQHVVHTQTNGSRLPSYYSELIRWSCIGISVHLEFADPAKIVEVARAVVQMKSNDEQARRHWFGLRIMVAPGMYAKAHSLYEAIRTIPEFETHATVFMSALYRRDHRDQMMTYDPDEFRAILALS